MPVLHTRAELLAAPDDDHHTILLTMPSTPDAPAERPATMRFTIQVLGQLKPILQGFRRQAGMTQADMASKLGITQQSYAQIEAHPERTSVERLFIVLALMGVELHLDGGKMQQRLSTSGAPSKQRAAPLAIKRVPGDTTSW